MQAPKSGDSTCASPEMPQRAEHIPLQSRRSSNAYPVGKSIRFYSGLPVASNRGVKFVRGQYVVQGRKQNCVFACSVGAIHSYEQMKTLAQFLSLGRGG